MKDKGRKPKKKQKLPPIYETSKKEFEELLKRANQPVTEKKPKKT
jgi:hypothetical protein